jgi:uncharacterized protein (TIGR02271 family)
MQHTLIAVFDNRSDAQKAMDELLQCGFARDEVRLTEDTGASIGGQSATTDTRDEGVTGKVKHFFSDLFGTDNSEHSEKYATAVSRGHHVLTVTAADEPEIERAADVVERYGPVDIDEKAAQWGGGAGVGRSEAMRMSGAGGMQQAQGASLQSHSDPNLFQQQSLNNDVPRGTTYQEPAEDSFTLNTPSAGSRQGSDMQGSQQRDTSVSGGVIGSTPGTTAGSTSSTAIPVVQEQLKVGKREVQRGGVRVFSRIVETPVDQSIGLREEHVNIERHAVDQPVSPADATAFREQTIELRETAEEAVVEKSARVVEEVVVNKEVSEHEEKIHGTVRHTEVEVEQLGGAALDDDSYFRSHWTSTYGASGGAYDDYAPAYSYGRAMRKTYAGRNWDDVETDVRSSWDQRNKSGGASTWEKFKAAIRHGWDRITD